MKNMYSLGGVILMLVVLTASSCGTNISLDKDVNTNVPEATKESVTDDASSVGKVITIDYTDSGFNPTLVNISVGDTVKFVNKSSSPFWPASDPHPIHTGLAGFDAKSQVAVGESFSFKFTKTGSFGFHNHLKPTAKGKVVVE